MRFVKILLLLLPSLLLGYQPNPLANATVFQLENGMEVILVENHANPMITAFTIVRAGSRLEDAQMNGAAHFLEHLLFNGTESRTQKQLYDEMDFYGGYNNAHTGPDFTNYMILMPKEYIAEGMDIQADMLFNSTLLQEKFEKERGIVIEEIGQTADRATYQVENHFLREFFAGTPYARPVLGTTSTIRHLPRDRVMDYYKTWYVPNNMTLMVIGDFHTDAMIELIKEKYGVYAAGALPELPSIALTQNNAADIRETTAIGTFPSDKKYLTFGYVLPAPSHEDFASFELMNEFIAGNSNAYLQEKIAASTFKDAIKSISSSLQFNQDFSYLQLRFELEKWANHKAIANKTLQILANVGGYMVPQAPLTATQTARSTEEIYLLEKLHYYGIMKASYVAAGGFRFLQNYQHALQNVTPVSIQRAAIAYLAGQTPVITLMQARDEQPEMSNGHSPNSYAIDTLSNGLTLVTEYNPDSPVIGIHLLAKERALSEGQDKWGMTAILQRTLLAGGTDELPGEKFMQAMTEIGAEFKVHDNTWIPYDDYYTSPRFAFMRLKVIDLHIEHGLALLADIVQNGKLHAEHFEKAQKTVAGAAQNDAASTPKIAERLFYDQLFGENPGYGYTNGTAESVQRITRDDVKKFYADFYNPSNLMLTISGNQSIETVKSIVEIYWGEEWGNTGWQPPVPAADFQPLNRTVRKAVGKKQSYIYLGNRFEIEAKDKAALDVLISIFSDRLAFKLREEQGLAYRVGASTSSIGGQRFYSVRMGTAPENIDTAVAGIKAEIAAMRGSEILQDELQKTVNAALGRRGMRRLDRVSRAYYISQHVFTGGAPQTDEKHADALKAVTLEDVQRVQKQVFATDGPLVVIAE